MDLAVATIKTSIVAAGIPSGPSLDAAGTPASTSLSETACARTPGGAGLPAPPCPAAGPPIRTLFQRGTPSHHETLSPVFAAACCSSPAPVWLPMRARLR